MLLIHRTTDIAGRLLGWTLSLWFLAPCLDARADWVSLTGAEKATTIAEVYIEGERVLVSLEIGDVDLPVFKDILPDDGVGSGKLDQRLLRFSERVFQLVTETGERLRPQLKLAERRPRTVRGAAPRDANGGSPDTQPLVIDAELVYPLKTRPNELTIVPPLDSAGKAVAEVGMVVFHKTIPVIDYQYLSGPERLRLNWPDPWRTRFENPGLTRHHSSALMSFLYIEPYEVRHEVLARVKDLREWLDLGLKDDQFIDIDELEGVKQRIGEFLSARNPVQVDGKVLRPILDRVDYIQIGLGSIQSLQRPGRLELATAMVGVVVAYITDGLPRSVSVDWDLFNKDTRQVPITAFDPIGEFVSYVTPDEPRFGWPNFPEDLELLKDHVPVKVNELTISKAATRMTLPVGSIACFILLLLMLWRIMARRRHGWPVGSQAMIGAFLIAGIIFLYPAPRVSLGRPAFLAPSLPLDEKQAILTQLLKNVYRAFDFRAEEDVYDKLAMSVGGDLLHEIYLENRTSLAVQKAGGAQAKIKAVELTYVAVQPGPERPLAFRLRSKWTAQGTVGHWGHVHSRENLYDASITVEPVDGAWKITELELLEERRHAPDKAPGVAG